MAQQSYFDSCAKLQQEIYVDIMMFLSKQGISSLNQIHCDLNIESAAVNVAHAREIALYSCNRQTDRRGRNYFCHLEAVANMFNDPVLKCVAYLHDIMEGSDTVDSTVLLSSGFHPVIVGAVSLLTRARRMHYKSHLDRILQSPIATVVKLAELMDNSDVRGLKNCKEDDFKRLEKYANSVRYLIQKSGDVRQVGAGKYKNLRGAYNEATLGL